LSVAFLLTAIGVFLGASRIHFLVLTLIVAVAILISNAKLSYRFAMLMLVIAVGSVVLNEDRMQRFKTLDNTEYVVTRVRGSTSASLVEIASKYPLGNGLGGGGTSIPYFLEDRLEDPQVEENEYMRICLELGVPGLFLFVSFLLWVFSRKFRNTRYDPWKFGRRLAYFTALAYCVIGMLGIGMMSSIPQTCLFLMCIGWISTRPDTQEYEPVSA